MPRRSRGEVEETDAEEEEERRQRRRTSEFIDDIAEEEDEEDEDEDDEDEDEEEEEEGGSNKRRRRGTSASQFIDDQAIVASDDEEEDDDEIEDGFIVHEDEQEEGGGGDSGGRRAFRRSPFPLLPREDYEEEDIEAMEKRILEKYGGGMVDDEVDDYDDDDDDDHNETRQQALLPSVRDPKLWMVKCVVGHEREVAISLLQRHMNRGSDIPLIKSAIALDHLKSYVYIEADKEAHVKEACRGLRYIFHSVKPMLVPIKEMTDVVSVRSNAAENVNLLAPDTWVRMKIASYKGDLARVVEVDDVKKKITVKLVPRVDLQAIADKFQGLEVTKKKIVPQRLMNIDEARDLGLPAICKRDRISGEPFESVGGMTFRDGFLFKTVSMKSVSTENIQPTLDEFEKFWMPENAKNLNEAVSMEDSAESIFGNRKKNKFIPGNAVIVVSGDLVNMMGSVDRVDGDIVYITPKMKGFPDTAIPIHEKHLSKYFKPGDHVKVVSGEREGESGMVLTVQGRVLRIVSDATKEDIQVFADHVVGSSDVTCGVLRVGEYELHDLVLLDNGFGVILRVESGAFQVLKGNTEKAEVVVVRLREIKTKLDRRSNAQDRHGNVISAKALVTIVEGPCKGKQGTVEHIYRGVLFLRDRYHLEQSGFICVKARSCTVLGGTCSTEHKNNNYLARNQTVRTAPHMPTNNSRPPTDFRGRHMAGSRGRDSLIGTSVRICAGAFKGYRGIVKEVHGKSVRVELESQMKVIAVDRDHISDRATVSSQYGSQTPIHAARTPLRPCMTPQRDPRATPIHDGMRTPMHDRAWNPYYAPVTPARENWDNDGSWRTSPGNQPGTPLYQPGTPTVRLRESSPGFRSTPTHQSPQLSPRMLTVGNQ